MRNLALAIVLLFAAVKAGGQDMFDYSDIKSGKFSARSVRGVLSMKDGEHYTLARSGNIEKYAYKTGELVSTVFSASGSGLPDGRFADYAFSADETKLLIATNVKRIYRHSFTADYWVYDIRSKSLRRLTEGGGEQVAAFSPDGGRVAFVRDNDLYYVDLGDWSLHRITEDGLHNHIINGHTDWVYEEEFGFTRAFQFSPDGSKLAFLRFDESEVKEYTMILFGDRLYPEPYSFKYPKAGERNSEVELHVYEFAGGVTTRMDTGQEKDQYIPRLGWTPEGSLWFFRSNRLQNHFELLLADGGRSRVIYDERDARYVERLDDETVTFLPKGRFVVRNETSGYTHLYLYAIDKDGEKARVTDTLTQGSWDVAKLVDVTGDRVYYLSHEGSPLRNNLWSVKLNGKGKTRLTGEEGTYSISPSAGFKYFISYFSNVSTPNIVRLHDPSGKVLRTMEDNAALKEVLIAKKVPRKEFFKFTTVQGTTLNGYMIKPADFDGSRRYPVMMTQYSGPGSQTVIDRWSIDWLDVLVQEGYIVVCVDGRGTGGRGAEFKKCTYGNLGGLETEDQIGAAKYLSTLPYVDPSRIGIYGWSFGGFMSLNCILKGSDVFKMAIAVAPVTSWRFYDSIYTEIYNGLPQYNPRGYDENSPLNFAANLKGKLLMVHGSADDNVHLQNTCGMASAFVKAGKQFDMAVYPDDNHSMVPGGQHHVRELMIDYTLRNL